MHSLTYENRTSNELFKIAGEFIINASNDRVFNDIFVKTNVKSMKDGLKKRVNFILKMAPQLPGLTTRKIY